MREEAKVEPTHRHPADSHSRGDGPRERFSGLAEQFFYWVMFFGFLEETLRRVARSSGHLPKLLGPIILLLLGAGVGAAGCGLVVAWWIRRRSTRRAEFSRTSSLVVLSSGSEVERKEEIPPKQAGDEPAGRPGGMRAFLEWIFRPAFRFAILLMAAAFVASFSLGSTPPSPETAPSSPIASSSSSTTPPPATAENYIGRLIDPVRAELAALGITVVEEGVVDSTKREGEIVGQSPMPGALVGRRMTLSVVRNPPKVDLLDCCTRVGGDSPCYDWSTEAATIGKTTYDPALRWTDPYGCGVTEHDVIITLSADLAITHLTGAAGIPNDSDINSDVTVRVIVKIDGQEKIRKNVSPVNPLLLDLDVADASRVELLFTIPDPEVRAQLAVGGLFGTQGTP